MRVVVYVPVWQCCLPPFQSVSVDAVWCNRSLEFVRPMHRGPGDPNLTGAAGSLRAIPRINPGSMRSIVAGGGPTRSMRVLTSAPPPAGCMRAVASAMTMTTASAASVAAAADHAAGGAGIGVVDAPRVHAAAAEAEAPSAGVRSRAQRQSFQRKVVHHTISCT